MSLSFSALAVLVVSGFLSLQPINDDVASAQNTSACGDFSGLSLPVPTGQISGHLAGVANSGQVDFDSEIPQSFQSCREKSPRQGAQAHQFTAPMSRQNGNLVRGWAWNNNLGYLSLSCIGGTNIAASCGSVDYGVITNSFDASSDRVRGFAYGDAIGWVSMECSSGRNMNVNCGSIDYGVKFAIVDNFDAAAFGCNQNLQKGQMYGYAWADSVGWINMCQTSVDILNSTTVPPNGGPGAGPISPVAVTQNLSSSVSQGGSLSGGAIYANGVDYHEVRVEIRELDQTTGQPMPQTVSQADLQRLNVTSVDVPGGSFAIDNLVELDQTRNAPTQTSCAKTNITNAVRYGPLYSVCPEDFTADFEWTDAATSQPTSDTSVPGYYSLKIRSFAPTGNGYDLTVKSFAVNLTVNGAPLPSFDFNPNYALQFAPPVEVTAMTDASGNAAFNTAADTSEPVNYTLARAKPAGLLPLSHDNIAITSQIFDCSNEYDFMFDSGISGPSDDRARKASVVQISGSNNPAFPYGPGTLNPTQVCATGTRQIVDVYPGMLSEFITDTQWQAGQSAAAALVTGAADTLIYTEVKPGAQVGTSSNEAPGLQTSIAYQISEPSDTSIKHQVSYFSKRLSTGLIFNQAAEVRGNVRADIVDTTAPASQGRISQSIGEKAQSKREGFYRAVQNLTANLRLNAGATRQQQKNIKYQKVIGATAVHITETELRRLSGSDEILYFKRSPNATDPQEPCRIVIDGGANSLTRLAGLTTIVSEGCDIFVDNDVMEETPARKGRLGIIVLEDLSITGTSGAPAPARRGGNLYLCAVVRDFEANVVLDGTLFSYGKGQVGGIKDCFNKDAADISSFINPTTGLPQGNNPTTDLNWQLAMTGSLVSNNTYGGSASSSLLLGTGESVSSGQISTAKMYDLNYLRYGPSVPGCWANTVWLSRTLTPGNNQNADQNCATNNPDQRAITTIIYRAPDAQLPVFNAVK